MRAVKIPSNPQFEQTLQPEKFTTANFTKTTVIKMKLVLIILIIHVTTTIILQSKLKFRIHLTKILL